MLISNVHTDTCTCLLSHCEQKGGITPWHALLHKHTFGKHGYTPKKHTQNPGRQTPKSEDVLVSKQPRVRECSQPNHQSLSNYSHAPSLGHKSALISACCKIREYQIQHLLHLQTQPLKAQQSSSAGINRGRRGAGKDSGSKWRMKDWLSSGKYRCVCSCLSYLPWAFGFNHTAICLSASQGKKKRKRALFKCICKQLGSAQQKVFKGNGDIRREGKSTAWVTVKGQSWASEGQDRYEVKTGMSYLFEGLRYSPTVCPVSFRGR